MKKFIMSFIISIIIIFSYNMAFATEENNADIPEIPFDEYILMMKSKQAKVDIIKKNNISIEDLKVELKNAILKAAQKINDLKINISIDKVDITDDTLQELKELLQFLQDSKSTLEGDVDKIYKEINGILDLISTKGMQLIQYDELISKQNEVIVKMKSLLTTVNKI